MLSLFLSLAAAPVFAFHVVVDPGHGGHDRGAVNGRKAESEITLKIAKLVADDLRRRTDFRVTLTRDKDVFKSLEERAELAKGSANLFLSIHANASSDTRARGIELYFQNQLPPDEESLFLANRENQGARAVEFRDSRKHLSGDVLAIIEDLERSHRLKLSGQFAEALHRHWGGDKIHRRRSIRQAPFFVISNVDVPAALVEVGYLTHPKEAERLVDPEYQKNVARGLSQAIVRFKEVMDNKAPPSLN